MANDKASGGNITLIKNAPRDKDGKRKGNFSQADHSINTLTADIGLDSYGIYHFLLNNAGGNFQCTIKAIASVFSKKDQLSEDRIKRAINKLCKAGLLKKERCGYDGRRPLYSYQVYEVSTKIQTASTQDISKHHSTVTTSSMDNSAFSASEIEQVLSTQQPAPPPSLFITADTAEENTSTPEAQSAKASRKQSGDEYRQHIINICQSKGAFSQTAKDKVIKCCRKYYTETKLFADDDLIAQFANRFSENSGQNVATVYDDVMR